MRPTRFRYIISVFSCVLLLGIVPLACCKDECDDPTNRRCPNYDPCLSYVPANADFDILEVLFAIPNCGDRESTTFELQVDTVFPRGDITFRALHQADKYYWKIGSDPKVFTDKEFSLYFNVTAVGNINVTLIAEKDDFQHCTLSSTSRDTVTKTFHILSPPDNSMTDPWSLLHGNWRGSDTENPEDTFNIEIPPGFPRRINNLPRGCFDQPLDVRLWRKNIFFAGSAASCKRICGHGALQDDYKTLVIDYWIDGNSPGERIQKQFSGIKTE